MEENGALKNPLLENQVFLGRVVTIFAVIILLTFGLVGRLIYLQVMGYEGYVTRATSNRIKTAPSAPTRGIIYDRKGRILANNIPSYSLELIPEQIKDLDDTLKKLQTLLAIPDEKIKHFLKQKKRAKKFTSIPLLLRLNEEEVAKFAVVRPYFSGVDVHARLVRDYPYAEFTSHVVGYVGRINEKELKKLPRAEYRGTHHIGKVGIERAYEQQLHGQTGHVEIEANAQGRSIKTVVTDSPKPGADLYLSLDIDLQKIAYEAFGEKNGAAVAIEVKTGKVLAFISRPGFNTNLFVTGISSKAYKELQQSDDQPMFNRALRGQYPPGSTIKPFLGLAALEYNTNAFFKKVHCPGYYQLSNNSHKYRDWKVRGHGWVNMRQAITQSCDVYFYDLAFNLGIDRIHDFLQQFGFGEKTEIDLLGEKAGLIPSREWKKRVKQESWYHGETLITGIGQGFMQVTPLQLARATATLANNGDVVMPYLVEKIIGSNEQKREERQAGGKINFNIRNYFNIVSSMVNVIHGARGTARKLSKGIDYQIAGKTGTAQVFTIKQEEKYNEDEVKYKLRDHAVFMAFAPVSDPQIAVSVIVEHGGHGGSVAAPIAGKLIHQFLTGRPEVTVEN